MTQWDQINPKTFLFNTALAAIFMKLFGGKGKMLSLFASFFFTKMLILNWLIKKTLQQKGRKSQEGELDL